MDRVSTGAINEALLEALDGATYLLSRDGTVLEALDAPDATGFDVESPDTVPGSSLSSALPSEAVETVSDCLEAALSNGSQREVEFVASGDDGRRRYEARIIPLGDGGDRAVLVVKNAGPPGSVDPEQLWRAFDRAPIGIALSGPDSEDAPMQYVNRKFVDMTGYDRSEALGRNCRILQGENTSETRVSQLREAVENGESATVELRNYRADGTEFWNRVTIAPIDDGEDPRFVGFQEDVTEDRQRERKIRESERQYRRLTERITDGYYALDGDWNVTYWNDVMASRHGIPSAEVVGENIWEQFPSVEGTEIAETLRTAMETGAVKSCETYFEPLGGWLKVQVYPDEAGLSVISQDVTEFRDRGSELRETQRRLEMALDGTGTAVWEWEPVADEMTWTGSVDRLLGVDTATFRGSFGALLERVHPDDRDEVTRVATTVDRDDTFEVGCRIQRENHDDIWAELRGQVVDDDGTEHVVGTVTDVTERKEYERKIEESNERLEQFAYVASHDLQEPLRTVSNYVEILAEEYADELGDDAADLIEVATTGCDRMQSMINGLLDYSRVTTRGSDFEPVDSEEAVAGIVDDLGLLIDEHDGSVTWDELPTVEADPDQLRQVFQNLVKNALEHSEDAVSIHVSGQDTGDTVHFAVEDDGPGIEPGRQEEVFRIFNSGKQYQTSGQAKGIGLAICENIVDRHGGEIWIESEPGEGTTFHFTIDQ